MLVSTIDLAPWNPTCQGLCTSCASVSCFSSCKRSRERKWRATANLMLEKWHGGCTLSMKTSWHVQLSSNFTKWVSSYLISSHFKKETQISCKFWKQKITSMCTNASEVTHLSVDSTLVELLEPQKHKDDLPVPWKSGHKSCEARKRQHFFQVNKVETLRRLLRESGVLPLAIHSSLISHCFLTRARI